MKKEKEFMADKLQEVSLENEKYRQEYESLKKQSQLNLNEYQTLKENYETAQKYVKMLEAELNHMKNKIIRLNEIAEQY